MEVTKKDIKSLVEYLSKEKGIKQKQIANSLGVTIYVIKNIIGDKGFTVTNAMVNNALKYYKNEMIELGLISDPDLASNEGGPTQKEVDELTKRVDALEKLLIEKAWEYIEELKRGRDKRESEENS